MAPPPAAPTGRSPGVATSRAAAPSTPAWAAPRARTARPSFRTHLLGAIQWSAGMIRAGCKATIAANYERHAPGQRLEPAASPTPASRTALLPPPMAGSSTSAAPTAAPTSSAAQMIGTGAHAAHPRLREPQRRHRLRQRPHLGPRSGQRHRQQRRHARRDPAGLRRPRRRSRDQRQDRGRPARHRRVARLHADRAHLPAVLPDLQPRQPDPPGPRRRRPAPDHEDGQAADLALHGQPARPSSSISTPRS